MTAATRTKTTKSAIVDNLSLRRIDARSYEVESRSITLGSHIVRRAWHGDWTCDSWCMAYRSNYRCSHVGSVIRAEAERAMIAAEPPQELVLSDNCCWDAGNLPGNPACICICHSQAAMNVPAIKKLTLEDVFADYA